MLFALCLCIATLHCNAQTTIQMEDNGGVYKIPCSVNGLRLKMIFDPGASNVCISESVAIMMLENDYLSIDDIKGTSQSQVADGRIVDHTKIILKKVQIGDKTLTNVEAVVIHGQDAPLLFGQSALRRLGCYTISGDKLILGTDTFGSQQTKALALSDDEIDQLIQEADDAIYDGAYSIALEKYQILHNNGYLNSYGEMGYADCLYYLDQNEVALEIYKSIQSGIETDFPQKKEDLYFRLGKCLWKLDDYDAALYYLQKVKYSAEAWSERQNDVVNIMSFIYINKGDEYKAKKILEDYISQYLSYMEIKATDCWNKKYIDKFIANLYYGRSLTYITSNESDYEKYTIIAAAWGNKDAIEWCKKYELDYSKKPYKYEY